MSTYKSIRLMLIKLNYKFRLLNENIEKLISYMAKPVTIEHERKKLLLTLPSHLVKTFFSLETLGKASAEQVSFLTGKKRAVESSYLNQLCVLGLISKEKEGRTSMFQIMK